MHFQCISNACSINFNAFRWHFDVFTQAGWLTSAASFFMGHQAEEYLPVKDVWPVDVQEVQPLEAIRDPLDDQL